MRTNLRFFLTAILCAITASVSAKNAMPSIEPPFWWSGMNSPKLQLMVHGDNIRDAVPSIDYAGVTIDSIARLDSKNYQFLYLNVSPQAQPGTMTIVFKNGKKSVKVPYELKKRDGIMPDAFSSEDVLYLIMPDR